MIEKMIEKMIGVMKPVGVTIVDGGGGSGCCLYLLKKKLWLRLFHILTFQDTSVFLLDTFKKPVSFNRVEVGDFFIGSLEYSIIYGYKSTHSNDCARVRIEFKSSLSMLCLCPWVYGYKTPAKITTSEQYRIGKVKLDSTVGFGLQLIKEASK